MSKRTYQPHNKSKEKDPRLSCENENRIRKRRDQKKTGKRKETAFRLIGFSLQWIV